MKMEKQIPSKRLNLAGLKFFRLTAIRDVGSNSAGRRIWLCKCDCGNETQVVASKLKNGHTKSCGCWHKESRKGANNPNWQGGANNRGTIAWCQKRLLTAQKTATKNGYAGIAISPRNLSKYMARHDERCAICKIHKDEIDQEFHLDHCHKTGKFRGLLCPTCNTGIGCLRESEEILLKAINYLNDSGTLKVSAG